jgi:hypothetical protein
MALKLHIEIPARVLRSARAAMVKNTVGTKTARALYGIVAYIIGFSPEQFGLCSSEAIWDLGTAKVGA